MLKIKKAVFPVAGLGTRFLPATKANPKEMLPIVDKPLIQYAVEEAIHAGFTEMIFVTSSSKRTIEDHFDTNYELEARLAARDKQNMLMLTRNIIPKGVNCIYVRQPEPLGLGDAVLCARSIVGNEPFAVLLADDLFDCVGANCLQQMLQVHEDTQGASVIAVEELPLSKVHHYGVVGVNPKENQAYSINAIVEKPSPEKAPSNLGVAGRYILTSTIFKYLENRTQGTGGEIQLTDAISQLLQEEKIYALPFEGTRYDCGSKLGYLQATVTYARKHAEVGEEFENYLRGLM